MIKWLILLSLIGLPLIFLYVTDFQEKELKSDSNPDTVSILEIGEEFIKKASIENSTDDNILGTFREISESELLQETQLPDLKMSEKIMNNGIRLSTNYNQISYDYSVDKISIKEYFSELIDFRIKYEKYMTAIDSYIGDDDILIQKNSMVYELDEINQQITLLQNSKTFDGDWEQRSNYDKYKKFLPSMFAP